MIKPYSLNPLDPKVFLPVNNSLIDYPVKRYDRAFELASDVINENFTARDILESISEIEQRTKGITFEQFARNQTTVKAVLYDFIIIGEATRNVSKEIQSRYPLIPWRLMGGMRNIATHEYFQVNLSRVWATIQEDLPTLVPQLQEVLDGEVKIE